MTHSLLRLAPRGPTLLVVGVLAGLAAPALAEAMRPAMAASIFVIVLGTLLRVNAVDFVRRLQQPRFSALLPIVVMLICPMLVGVAAHVIGVGPELTLAMVLAVCAPPSGGTAAVARMLGLDATIPLAVTLLSMALAPLSVPLLASWFAGIAFDPVELALRLFVLTAVAGGVALILRRRAAAIVKRHADAIDGLVLAALLIFAISTMAGVRAQIEAEPMAAVACIVLAFACNLALQVLGTLLLPGTFAERLGIGLILGNRNVGLVWSALGASTSPTMALFFAATQFPIYMTPRLIVVLIRWATPEKAAS